ncbi:Imm49 family immunity protein [Streptomyces rubiginosohelvolus]|uniref:Imm49 family immunity protein n=1 Tax=Streptomyces rubiginosohelvolus TaxID=67362 RepID=UPI003F4DD7B3
MPALPARLDAYRESLDAYRESVGPAPAPRSLLPLDTLALAALAVQVHGWELGVRSGYLPAELLGRTHCAERRSRSPTTRFPGTRSSLAEQADRASFTPSKLG